PHTSRTPSATAKPQTTPRTSPPPTSPAHPAPSAADIGPNTSSTNRDSTAPPSISAGTSVPGRCKTSSPTTVTRNTRPRAASGANTGKSFTFRPWTTTGEGEDVNCSDMVLLSNAHKAGQHRKIARRSEERRVGKENSTREWEKD